VTPALASMVIAAAAQAAEPAPQRHPVVEFFVASCIDGRADLTGAREVAYSDLPPVVRRGYSRAAATRFWEVNERLYVILKNDAPSDYYRTLCAVMSRDIDLRQAHDQVWQVIWGRPPEPNREPGSPFLYEFSNFAEGYQFYARAGFPGNWVLLQIGHIGEGGRGRFEAAARRARRGSRDR
jgi:hypothetical protein